MVFLYIEFKCFAISSNTRDLRSQLKSEEGVLQHEVYSSKQPRTLLKIVIIIIIIIINNNNNSNNNNNNNNK